MHAEIADSDAESDFDVPHQPSSAPTSIPFNNASPVISVNFDDFISQSQQEPANVGSSNNTSNRATGSTEKLLRGIPEAQRALVSSSGATGGNMSEAGTPTDNKRRHTALDHGSSIELGGGSVGEDRRKRPRTYVGTSATARQTREDDEEDADEDVFPRQRNRPRRVISLLNESNNISSNMISTTRSSVGTHESINLDFRGSSYGLDIDQNPFGSVSQASMDGEVHLEDRQRLAEIFGNNADPSSTIPLTNSNDERDSLEQIGGMDGFNDSRVTAERSRSNDPSSLIEITTDSSRNRRKTGHEPSEMIDPSLLLKEGSGLSPLHEDDVSRANTIGKSRGRKNRLPSTSPFPEDQDEAVSTSKYDELLKAHREARRGISRGSTVEAESQASQAILEDVVPAGKKRGRKPSKKPSEETYEATVDTISPVKQLTGEASLNDENLIGLPQEQYKPRPSRSRSKRITEEEEMTVVQKESEFAADATPAKDTRTDMSPPKSTKKGKKSKVKRAKTSAAALLKKSDPMISDGEEDVMWMETKPAKVKLDVPPDLHPHQAVKDERAEMLEETPATATDANDGEQEAEQNDQEADDETSTAVKKTFTLEIPQPPSQLPTAEPKKRGRKRKKTLELEQDDQAPPTEVAEVQDQPSRPDEVPPPVLAKQPLPSPEEHPTPSPAEQTTTLDANQDKENVDPSSNPSPTKKAIDAGIGTKKHSPINPSGGKTKYRVGLSRRTAIPSLLKIVRPPKPKASAGNVGEFKVIRLEGEDRALLDD